MYIQRDYTCDFPCNAYLVGPLLNKCSEYYKDVNKTVKNSLAPSCKSIPWHPKFLVIERRCNVSLFCLQIQVVRYLVSHGVQSSRISVLTPYSAQRAKIKRALQAQVNSCDSEVLSVFASQGMCVGLLRTFSFHTQT